MNASSHIESVQTADGSWTCYNRAFDEHYHNRNGAQSESVNIYIKASQFETRLKESTHITLLDPFFGLGYNTLNALSAFRRLRKTQFPQASISVIAVENDPDILAFIPSAIQCLDVDDQNFFSGLFAHNVYYRTQAGYSDLLKTGKLDSDHGISFHLVTGDARQVVKALPESHVDLIYHDAFSPKKQPELWTTQLFQEYRRLLKPESGVIMTYSAAACVRRAFLDAGLYVQTIPIPGQKDGTLASTRPHPEWNDLTSLEVGLANCRSGIPYQDNDSLDASREAIVTQREEHYNISTLPNSSAVHRQYGHLKSSR